MFSSLQIRNYRVYWIGMFISLAGTWIQSTAQSWLVFELTKSSFLLGVVGFLGSIPIFLFSLLGGVVADRMSKRNILLVTQAVFMLLAFALALLTQTALVTPHLIMLIAVANGLVMSFDAPSRQAMVVELVGKKQLLNAIALNSVAFNSSRIIGPALAGVLVATIGMAGCFYLNAVSFLGAIGGLLMLRLPKFVGPKSDNSAFEDLRQGLSFVKHNRLVVALISMVGVSSFFGVSYVILMPVFAGDILKVGVKGLGMLMSFSGLGALAAALFLARLDNFAQKGKMLIIASFIFAFGLILFSITRNFVLCGVILFVTGAAALVAMALVNTILQTIVVDELRGRVMSVFMMTFAGVIPFGNLTAGIISQRWGVSTTVLVNGIVCALFFAIIAIYYPEIREV